MYVLLLFKEGRLLEQAQLYKNILITQNLNKQNKKGLITQKKKGLNNLRNLLIKEFVKLIAQRRKKNTLFVVLG